MRFRLEIRLKVPVRIYVAPITSYTEQRLTWSRSRIQTPAGVCKFYRSRSRIWSQDFPKIQDQESEPESKPKYESSYFLFVCNKTINLKQYHQLILEYYQESESHISKKFGAGAGVKIFGAGAE